jgi:hypothetical protein
MSLFHELTSPVPQYQHPFVCPGCLLYGEFYRDLRFLCGECGQALEDPMVLLGTPGSCSGCNSVLSLGGRPSAPGLMARCRGCGWGHQPAAPQEPDRVLGTLTAEDLGRLREAAGVPEHGAWGIRFFLIEAGDARTCILNLGDLANSQARLPFTHAAIAVEAIWLLGADTDPLSVAQVLDRFVRRAGFLAAWQQSIPIYVQHESISPSVGNLLANHFKNIRYGVRPEHLLPVGGGGAPE